MRDKRKELGYWSEKLARDDGRILTAQNNVKTALSDLRKRGRSDSRAIRLTFEKCLALYSSGAAVSDIAPIGRDLLCKVYPQHLKDKVGGKMYGPTRPGISRMLRYFSLLVLSAPTGEEAAQFIWAYDQWDYQGPPVPCERDKICERYVAYFGQPTADRPPATGVNWPAAYDNLWKAIDPNTADTSRFLFMTQFLDGWYQEMASELAAQTDRLRPETTPGLYAGYWCIEAAAAAVAFDIDDREFRNHDYYPKDWADWARLQKQKG